MVNARLKHWMSSPAFIVAVTSFLWHWFIFIMTINVVANLDAPLRIMNSGCELLAGIQLHDYEELSQFDVHCPKTEFFDIILVSLQTFTIIQGISSLMLILSVMYRKAMGMYPFLLSTVASAILNVLFFCLLLLQYQLVYASLIIPVLIDIIFVFVVIDELKNLPNSSISRTRISSNNLNFMDAFDTVVLQSENLPFYFNKSR